MRGQLPVNASLLIALLHGVLLTTGSVAAQPSAEFGGGTITINIGTTAGGGYDIYARVLARHLGRHIPGNPSIVPRNMPGAASLKAANYIYSIAPKDGTELGIFFASATMEPLMGNADAKFDPVKFSWIGSMDQAISFCGIWHRPGLASTFEETRAKEVVFGSTGPGGTGYQHAMVLKNILNSRIKVISGYPGIREINIAMQRGEIDGGCAMANSSLSSHWLPDLKAGRLKLLIQMGPKKTDEFGPVPSVYDYVSTDQDRQVMDLFFKPNLLYRPLAGAPGIPKERLAVLRKAFMNTMMDSAFLAEAKKANITIDQVEGDQVERLMGQFADYPPAVIKKAREVIGR